VLSQWSRRKHSFRLLTLVKYKDEIRWPDGGPLPKGATRPIYTSSVFVDEGGPIEQVKHTQMETIHDNLYEAVAYLSDKCVGKKGRPKKSVYGSGDGAGADHNLEMAVCKAVSEAMERWAYRETYQKDSSEYAYDINPTSNGMAATPGKSLQWCQKMASREAYERLLLMLFWEKEVYATPILTGVAAVNAYEITAEGCPYICVILEKVIGHNRYAFAFSGGSSYREAYPKAAVELARTEAALKQFYKNDGDVEQILNAENGSWLEKRSLYFSTPEGLDAFREKMEKAYDYKDSDIVKVETVFDGELKGPWNEWATVWRTVFKPLSGRAYDKEDHTYFFW